MIKSFVGESKLAVMPFELIEEPSEERREHPPTEPNEHWREEPLQDRLLAPPSVPPRVPEVLSPPPDAL